ncbi:hypothetical protein [Desnuesiella massiliensis]|uniref:AbrB/MazE/SpoVT family DNA-binding domain-containing protein n=1 Tax=Desnuesiella massiliensis TaxID=1650662 RepID=UPI0006E12570|nr:hypothetical protein [Desnuesiella massiliensis]
MKSKVTFNRSGSGSVSGKVVIPAAFLEILKITKDERDIEITLEGNKIIIEKGVTNIKKELEVNLTEMGYAVGERIRNEKDWFIEEFTKLTNGVKDAQKAKELAVKVATIAMEPVPRLFIKDTSVIYENWDLVLSYFGGVYIAIVK